MTVVDMQNRIEEILKDKGWSRYKLSQEMGVTDTQVKRLLERETYPNLQTIVSVCRAFDMTVGDFFSFDTSKTYGTNLTPSDMDLIEKKHRLERRKVERLITYADILLDMQIYDPEQVEE